MAKTRIFVIFLIVTICLLLVLETGVDARGGRGGGGRSGGGRFGGSRSSRSSRSSSSVRTSSGFRAGGLRWKQAATIGFIYGYASYSTRRMYRRYPDREPSICVNKYDFKRDNGTYYSYFICPKYNEPDSYTYCCGPRDRQRCCSYWQGPLRDEAGTNYRTGRAAGTVIGILLFLAMSICCCYCCCCRKRGEDPSRFESFKQRNFKGDQGGSGHYKQTSTTDACVPMSNFGPQSPDSDGQPDYPVNPGGYQGGYPNGPPGPPPGPPPYGGGYPPQPGYPPQTDPAYPPQPGYPPQPQPGYEYPGPGPAPGYTPYPGPGGPPPSGDPAYPQGPGDGSVPYPIAPAMYPEGAPYPGAPYPTAPYPGAPPPGAPPPGMYPNMPDAPYPGQQNGMPSGPPSAPPPTYSAATLPEKK